MVPPLVVGAILCGGASRRMGRPKALVLIDGVPMALRVASALRDGGATQVVLVGGDPTWSADLDLPQVPDRWPGEGPLGGLATAVLNARSTAGDTADAQAAVVVLVAACDQPWLDGVSLRLLVSTLEAHPGVDAALALTGPGRRQPFPSAWRAETAPALCALFESGARRADDAFGLFPVVEVGLPEGVVADVDRLSDLDRAEPAQGSRPDHPETAP